MGNEISNLHRTAKESNKEEAGEAKGKRRAREKKGTKGSKGEGGTLKEGTKMQGGHKGADSGIVTGPR